MKLNILLAALLLISSAMSRAAVPQTYIYRVFIALMSVSFTVLKASPK